MLAAALVVGDRLGRGFDRAAQAAISPTSSSASTRSPRRPVAQRIRALPDLKAFSLRQEATDVELGADEPQRRQRVVAELIGAGPHGYAIVAGRDVSDTPGEVVVERGLAAAWGLPLGDVIDIDRARAAAGRWLRRGARQRRLSARGAADLPLAQALEARFGAGPEPATSTKRRSGCATRATSNAVLVQARATSYGLHGLRFVTRSGVRVLLDQAAGIVIDLLVALSLIALADRGRAARRLRARRGRAAPAARSGSVARSAPRAATSTLVQALEALLVALPAATIGTIAGALATAGPSDRLLTLLNEPAAGGGAAGAARRRLGAQRRDPGAGRGLAGVAGGRRPPVELLGGAELAARGARGAAYESAAPGSPLLGGRLAAARRTRLVATAVTLGLSTAFVLLMLALASALSALETDPRRTWQALPADRPICRLSRTAASVDPRRPGGRTALRGPGGRLVLARGDDRRDRLSGQPHGVRGAAADAPVTGCSGHRRGRGRRRAGRRARALARLDARDPIPVRHRAAAPGRRRRQLARSRRPRRVRPGSAMLARRPVRRPSSSRSCSSRAQTQARSRASSGPTASPATTAVGKRRPAGEHAAHDPDRGRDRRRARVPVRADPGVRADGAGTPTHGRGPARLRRGLAARSGVCWPARPPRS